MARFHILSLAAMVLNVLLWPLISMSLLSGFGVLLFGPLCPPLGYLCGWMCDGSFWLLEGGVKLGDRLPYGHFWLPGPADWWLWGFYGAVGLAVAFPRLRPPAALVRCIVGRVDRRWASPPPRGGTIAAGSIAPFSASATAARCYRVSLRQNDALRRRADGRARPGVAHHLRFPLGSRPDASRRRGALPSRHRPLQRPAGVARTSSRSERSTFRR